LGDGFGLGHSGTSSLKTQLLTTSEQNLLMIVMRNRIAFASSETNGKSVPQAPLRVQPPSDPHRRPIARAASRSAHSVFDLLIPAAERTRREDRDGEAPAYHECFLLIELPKPSNPVQAVASGASHGIHSGSGVAGSASLFIMPARVFSFRAVLIILDPLKELRPPLV
jgi:hypothetical protein